MLLELSVVLEIPVVGLATVHAMDVMELKPLAFNALSTITLLDHLVSHVLTEHGKLLEIQHAQPVMLNVIAVSVPQQPVFNVL